jgi:hypothetical protein
MPTSHALNPVLRLMGRKRELLHEEIGVAAWSQRACWNNGLTDLELVYHAYLPDWRNYPLSLAKIFIE